ncbi:UTRA domain-containing protein [Streptomyces sp. NPDC048331]|uniref:UTRA domain-containing protein n=1 Tax=Streptomyces sp. NPDC048331 TaxID=3365534 RepID=UPI003712A3AF
MPYLTARPPGAADAWTEEAAAAGLRGGQRILRVAYGRDATQAHPTRRRADGVDRQHCPRDIAVGTALAGAAKIRGGAVTLPTALGHIGARIPREEERERLRLGAGEPVLRLTRTTYDATDSPIQADVMLMPAGRQQVRYEIRLGPSQPG